LEIVGKDVPSPAASCQLAFRQPHRDYLGSGAMEVLKLNEVAGKDSEAENVADEETVLIPLPLPIAIIPLTYELTVVPPRLRAESVFTKTSHQLRGQAHAEN